MSKNDEKIGTTAFYGVFKSKLDRQKADIKQELERAKSDRRKGWLKNQLKETKSLQKTVKKMEDMLGQNEVTHCPHCGGSLK